VFIFIHTSIDQSKKRVILYRITYTEMMINVW